MRLTLSVFIWALGKSVHFCLHHVLHVKVKGALFAAGVLSFHAEMFILF